MKNKTKIHPKNLCGKLLLFLAAVCFVLVLVPKPVYAEESFLEVIGSVFEFDKKSSYEITDAAGAVQSRHDNTYGKFSVQAEMAGIKEEDGMLKVGVRGGTVGFYYSYGDGALYEDARSGDWVLMKDTGKKIDGMKMDSKIGKGTILLQSSEDGSSWNTVLTQTDAFEETPYRAHPIYSANIERFAQGSYFRVIVVYKEQRLTETKKILFFDIDKYEYRKKAEVYEFYLYEANIDETLLHDIESQAASGAGILEEAADAADAAEPALPHKNTTAVILSAAGVIILILVIVFIIFQKRKNRLN